MSEPVLVLASHNAGKLRELREILRGSVAGLDVDTQVVDASAVDAPDVAETGTSFAENSLLKARAVAEATGLPAVADDSGLCVDVMNGAPGIFSARWSGVHGRDEDNLRLLLAQIADVPDASRGAAFVCAATLCTPDGREAVEIGRMTGTLLREPAGDGGFGYDPIFVPEDLSDLDDGRWAGLTAAQIPAEAKNAISHRGRAFGALLPHLLAALDPDAGRHGSGL